MEYRVYTSGTVGRTAFPFTGDLQFYTFQLALLLLNRLQDM